jgi:hypothetical protein
MYIPNARVAELVDARDSKSRAAMRAGSIPAPGTKKIMACILQVIFSLNLNA